MTKKLGDRIRQTTETEGVGPIALITPEPGYASFVDALGDGAETLYVFDNGLGQYEGGWGTISAGPTDTIGRTAGNVIFGSAGPGVLVDFSAGVKTVVCGNSAKVVMWSADTFSANNVPMHDGAFFRAKTRAQVAKRVTVDLVATANVNLASGLVAGGAIDGVTLSLTGSDDGGPHLVLLTAQTTASQNGFYPVVASGASARHSDYNTAAKIPPMLKVAVRQGTAGAGTEYLHTTAPGFVLDTTALTFAKRNSAHVGEIANWGGANDDFAQQKAGVIANRTPTQAAVDLAGVFANDAISGNKIDGGTISHFSSTGIADSATAQTITISSANNVGINIPATSGVSVYVSGDTTGTATVFEVDATAGAVLFYSGKSTQSTSLGENAGNAALKIRKDTTTGRSVNSAGTNNAAGADYADYYFKSEGCGPILKGQGVGFDADGLITDKWTYAISFGIKSTAPSVVGGDAWGSGESLGLDQPVPPQAPTEPVDDGRISYDDLAAALEAYPAALSSYQAAVQQFQTDKSAFDAAYEAQRQKVDRIAVAGKVPAIISGTPSAGDWIVPEQDGAGIKLVAISDAAVTFDQYKKRVGRVLIANPTDDQFKSLVDGMGIVEGWNAIIDVVKG